MCWPSLRLSGAWSLHGAISLGRIFVDAACATAGAGLGARTLERQLRYGWFG
jgi:hypothetical protein